MPKYNYVLSSNSGVKTEGSIFAPDIDSAKRKLQDKDQIIISILKDTTKTIYFWQKPNLNFEEKMLFIKHLGTMIKVGVTTTEAFEILINQTKNRGVKRMYRNILDRIQSGQSLANSLKEYEYIFSEIFINMIATGEQSGTLEQTLEHLDKQIEKEYELRKKVLSAFIYPAVIISVTLVLTIGIIVFVMPKITKIFESFDVQLPLITRMLISFSKFVTASPLITVALTLGAILFLIFIFKTRFLKPFWARFFIHTPVFGKIIIYSNLARFARTINSLLQSGVPITEAVEISYKNINNTLYKNILKDAHEKMKQGAKLGKSLENHEELFPPLVTKLLFIGESTGSIEITTDRLADLYEKNVDSITKNLSVLLEPILLVFMAVLIGGIALSIILPIYQLPNLIKR